MGSAKLPFGRGMRNLAPSAAPGSRCLASGAWGHYSLLMGPVTKRRKRQMTDTVDAQASLEAELKGEILRMYEEVAVQPDGDFHFFHGRTAAEMFEYDRELLDRAPPSAVASFAGVGNPHLRSELQPGETVLDLGSGAGLDGIIAAWRVGPTGSVIGVDLNPAMCLRAKSNAELSGTCRASASATSRRRTPRRPTG